MASELPPAEPRHAQYARRRENHELAEEGLRRVAVRRGIFGCRATDIALATFFSQPHRKPHNEVWPLESLIPLEEEGG